MGALGRKVRAGFSRIRFFIRQISSVPCVLWAHKAHQKRRLAQVVAQVCLCAVIGIGACGGAHLFFNVALAAEATDEANEASTDGEGDVASTNAYESDGSTQDAAADGTGDAAADDTGDEASSGETDGQSQGASRVDADPQNRVDPAQAADNSFIYDTTIEAILASPEIYNDQVVQMVGEVVGDAIIDNDQRDRRWIMVTSTKTESAASISVFMSEQQAQQIDTYGRYGAQGTIVQIRGTFHETCPVHEGLTDIHASNVSVVKRGTTSPDVFTWKAFIPGIVFCVLGLAILFAFRIVRERQR